MAAPSLAPRPGAITTYSNVSTTTTTTTTSPPASPSTTGRLRGFSYLRNYTQTHILSRDNHSSHRPSITRTASQPTSSSTAVLDSESASPDLVQAQRSATDLPHPTPATSAAATAPARSSDPEIQMARTRSASVAGATDMPQLATAGETRPQADTQATTTAAPNLTQGMPHQLPSIRFTSHQDLRAARPSLVFNSMARILPTGTEVIKVGRYSERDSQPPQASNVPSSAPVGFKSKVVSRRHCEFYCSKGKWFIKDVKSSSGTFLNHIRLSAPGTESRPFPVNDGDIVQLGIDFKGGEEMIFRCVKIRVELNKGWQIAPNAFNVQSHKRLREMNKNTGGSSQDCSICIGPIAPCQSLFVAPCSHTWHFKCIRVLINGPQFPHFICPNCRQTANLDAELDGDEPEVSAEYWDDTQPRLEIVNPDIPAEDEAPEPRSHQQRQADSTDATYTATEAGPELDIEPSSHSDGEVVDIATSEDSGDAGLEDAMGYLNISNTSSQPSLVSSDPPQVSNATSAPLDIVRKPVPLSSAQLGSRSMRTPSPTNGQSSSLAEGPMTPRNDVGPFVFDGRAPNSQDVTSTLGLGTTTPSPLSEPVSLALTSNQPSLEHA